MVDSKRFDKTVLVTGSSGFVGQKLLRALSARGVRTIAAYHHGCVETLPNTFPFKCDLRNKAEVHALVQRSDIVVHCAWLASDRKEHKEFNLSLTSTLCSAIHQTSGKLILLSSNGASRHSKNPFLSLKYRVELEAINSELGSIDIVRLPPLFDLKGHSSPLRSALCHLFRSPLLYPKSGENKFVRPLYVGDLAELLADRVTTETSAVAQVLAAHGPSEISIAELSDLARSAFHKKTKIAVKGVWAEHLLRWLGESPAVKAKAQAPLEVLSTKKSSGSAFTGLAKAVTTANLLDIRKAWAPTLK